MKKSTNKRNGDEILAKLDALEKAYKELRKVVLDGVNTSAPKKPAPKPSKRFEYKDSTFLYECMDETRNQRLSALYVGLKQLNLIDQRTQQKQQRRRPALHKLTALRKIYRFETAFFVIITQKACFCQ